MVNGLPVPSPLCTTGAVNPTVTLEVLRSAAVSTDCLRNKATSADGKDVTYDWYGVAKPSQDTGKQRTCERDHLIALELGGADTLANIWPECGPPGVQLSRRYFKEKDRVENFLAERVKAGAISLRDAQQGVRY